MEVVEIRLGYSAARWHEYFTRHMSRFVIALPYYLSPVKPTELWRTIDILHHALFPA